MDDHQVVESKRMQLEILQTRINLHGGRMWQLPLTYLGAIALALTAYSNIETDVSLKLVYIALVIIGMLILLCFYGALEGYRRTAKFMSEIENELEVKNATKLHWAQYVPYLALLIFGIVGCIYASLKFD